MAARTDPILQLSVGQAVTIHVLAGPAYGQYETSAAENLATDAQETVLLDPAHGGDGDGAPPEGEAGLRPRTAPDIGPGTPVRVSVAEGSQVITYETIVARRSFSKLYLEPPVWHERRQRRQHVRVQVTLVTAFAPIPTEKGEGAGGDHLPSPEPGAKPEDWVKADPYRVVRGRTRDLSAGGMLLISPVRLHRGDRIRALVDLGRYGPIQVVAECVRQSGKTVMLGREHSMLAMRFAHIDRSSQEKVISLVFEVQRRQLAAGVSSAPPTARGVGA